MDTTIYVADAQPGDRFEIQNSDATVTLVERIIPDKLAGLQHDDRLHGSGAPFIRLHYTRWSAQVSREIASFKDYSEQSAITVHRVAA